MALVVMAAPGNLTRPHGQHRLAAIEGLDLALFVDAEHDRMLGRRHVKSDDIPHFGNKVGIGRKFERLDPMRLKTKGAPDALHGRGRDSGRLGHAARTPMRGILRSAFQGPHNDRLDTVVLNRTRCAGTRLVMQPIHSLLDKPATPFAHCSLGDPQAGCNLLVLHTPSAFQDNPRSQRQGLRRLRRDESNLSSVRSASLRTNSAILRAIRDPFAAPQPPCHSTKNL
jgi:hypothetical protein